ncbi:hypothetical protein ES703_15835 [subsurface metagenome]
MFKSNKSFISLFIPLMLTFCTYGAGEDQTSSSLEWVSPSVRIVIERESYYLGMVEDGGQKYLAAKTKDGQIIRDAVTLKKIFFIQHVYRFTFTKPNKPLRLEQIDRAIENLQATLTMSYLSDAVLFLRDASARALCEAFLAVASGSTSTGKTIAEAAAISSAKAFVSDPVTYAKGVNYLTMQSALNRLQRAKAIISDDMRSGNFTFERARPIEQDIVFGLSRSNTSQVLQGQLYLTSGGGGDLVSQLNKVGEIILDQLIGKVTESFKHKALIDEAILGARITDFLIRNCPAYAKYVRDTRNLEKDFQYETSQYYTQVIEPTINRWAKVHSAMQHVLRFGTAVLKEFATTGETFDFSLNSVVTFKDKESYLGSSDGDIYFDEMKMWAENRAVSRCTFYGRDLYWKAKAELRLERPNLKEWELGNLAWRRVGEEILRRARSIDLRAVRIPEEGYTWPLGEDAYGIVRVGALPAVESWEGMIYFIKCKDHNGYAALRIIRIDVDKGIYEFEWKYEPAARGISSNTEPALSSPEEALKSYYRSLVKFDAEALREAISADFYRSEMGGSMDSVKDGRGRQLLSALRRIVFVKRGIYAGDEAIAVKEYYPIEKWKDLEDLGFHFFCFEDSQGDLIGLPDTTDSSIEGLDAHWLVGTHIYTFNNEDGNWKVDVEYGGSLEPRSYEPRDRLFFRRMENESLLNYTFLTAIGKFVSEPLSNLSSESKIEKPMRAKGIAPAGLTEKQELSWRNLVSIGKFLLIYQHEHENKFPPNLQELVERTELPLEALESPCKPKGFDGSSYIYIQGHTIASDPRYSIILYENPEFCTDRINALFTDSRVEAMKPDEFLCKLEATYKRLGRKMPEIKFKGSQ